MCVCIYVKYIIDSLIPTFITISDSTSFIFSVISPPKHRLRGEILYMLYPYVRRLYLSTPCWTTMVLYWSETHDIFYFSVKTQPSIE